MNRGEFIDLPEGEQNYFDITCHITKSKLSTTDDLIDELKHTKADEDKLYELFGILEQAEEYRFNLK